MKLEVDYDSIILKDVKYKYLLLSIFFFSLKYIFLSLKFYYVSALKKSKNQFLFFFKAEYVIQFVDLIIPIPNIEDFLRFLLLDKLNKPVKESVTIIFLNRVVGFIGVSFLFIFSSYFGFQFFLKYRENIKALFMILKIGLLIFILLLTVIFFSKKIKNKIKNIGLKFKTVDLRNVKFGLSFLFLFLHYLSWILSIYCMFESVDLNIPIYQILVILPFLVISVIIPISYQGLGIPETTLLLYLTYLGVSIDLSLSIALMHLLNYLSVIFVGFLLFTFSKDFKLDFSNLKKKTYLA